MTPSRTNKNSLPLEIQAQLILDTNRGSGSNPELCEFLWRPNKHKGHPRDKVRKRFCALRDQKCLGDSKVWQGPVTWAKEFLENKESECRYQQMSECVHVFCVAQCATFANQVANLFVSSAAKKKDDVDEDCVDLEELDKELDGINLENKKPPSPKTRNQKKASTSSHTNKKTNDEPTFGQKQKKMSANNAVWVKAKAPKHVPRRLRTNSTAMQMTTSFLKLPSPTMCC